MTRRDGIMAVLTASAGLMGGRYAEAGSTATVATMNVKGGVIFNLDAWTEFTFTCGNDTVVLKPEEIMAALKSA